ncbi:hypothetical protein K2173_024238 [Erythroxylum novogranatense]|uniref:non-specific serine/threonine protein kinase n=1 Tax=Erythroxylum novogranatense TaxID=1862640 RepID=A0AAV8UFP8_9ROSI|nr:hypothetical protein K2173_024238 [Erythroxylum novogranatense]
MGIWCSCLAFKSNSVKAHADQVQGSVPTSPPSPDPAPSIIGNLTDGDTSFLGSNVSGTSWVSMATSNITTWLAQASGAIGAFWLNNNDNEFPVAIDDEELPDVGSVNESKLRVFTYAELKAATFNFRSDMVLGKGGFGSVYKGWLKEKLPSRGTKKLAIAVKKLDSSSKQGLRQWRTEVGFLRRLSHPNIIKLLGYCQENGELLIVYEFMQKGSLNYHLFGKGSRGVLSWEVRIQIAKGIAQGLCYLHTMEKPIIYRDFKSSNILLDVSYGAKISDFGLAKWGPRPTDGDQSISGHVMGTIGYAAPEYVLAGNLYVKSDVYSFGVVLVEMLTGLRAIDKNRPAGQHNLLDWTKPLLSVKRKLKGIMDPKLEGKYSVRQATEVAHLAIKCVNTNPKYRPSMKEVVDTLQKIEARCEAD